MQVDVGHGIDIEAPAGVVWDVLVATSDYARWNPFIRRLDGQLTAGERLDVEIAPPGGRAMTFRPRVLEASPAQALIWRGHLGVPGLFDGEHRFVIDAVSERSVRFIQSEQFSGLLVRPLRGLLAKTEAGFALMNQALKVEAERVAAGAPSGAEPEQ